MMCSSPLLCTMDSRAPASRPEENSTPQAVAPSPTQPLGHGSALWLQSTTAQFVYPLTPHDGGCWFPSPPPRHVPPPCTSEGRASLEAVGAGWGRRLQPGPAGGSCLVAGGTPALEVRWQLQLELQKARSHSFSDNLSPVTSLLLGHHLC